MKTPAPLAAAPRAADLPRSVRAPSWARSASAAVRSVSIARALMRSASRQLPGGRFGGKWKAHGRRRVGLLTTGALCTRPSSSRSRASRRAGPCGARRSRGSSGHLAEELLEPIPGRVSPRGNAPSSLGPAAHESGKSRAREKLRSATPSAVTGVAGLGTESR